MAGETATANAYDDGGRTGSRQEVKIDLLPLFDRCRRARRARCRTRRARVRDEVLHRKGQLRRGRRAGDGPHP